MKVLVGILHCIENELNECLHQISMQVGCDVESFVISGLPNREAHENLYRRFEEAKSTHEYFVKIDADMVLRSELFFSHLKSCFNVWPNVTHLEFPVYDHFTRRNIFGLHAWRNSHKWNVRQQESIFVDRANGEEVKARIGLETPAVADHCPNPTPFQAYHYGVHKAIKVTQVGQAVDEVQARAHWRNFSELESVHKLDGSLMTALPVIGFLDAVANKWGPEHVNYDCLATIQRCDSLTSRSASELTKSIHTDYGLYSSTWMTRRLRMFFAQYRARPWHSKEIYSLLRLLLRG